MSMNSLAGLLQSRARTNPVMRSAQAALVVEETNAILLAMFGEKVVEMANAAYVKHGVLAIACLGPTVAQEIKLHEQEILKRLWAKMGQNSVKRLTCIT